MFKAARVLVLSASALALCACASAPGASAGLRPSQSASASASAAGDRIGTPYGYYLAGQAALDAGDSRMAADYFAKASDANPDAGFIKERVFTSALLAGDVTRAAATAPGPGEGSSASRLLGVLAQAVEALAKGRGAEAYAKLSQPEPDAPYSSAAVLLKPWAAAAAGRWADALAMPETGSRLVKMIASLDQALLFERAGRYPEAETAFKAMMSERMGQSLVLPAYAVFLERRGRRKEAVGVYDQLLAGDPGDPAVTEARARALRKGKPPAQLSITEGAAQALMAPAAAALSDRQNEIALVYLRLILRLESNRDDAWLMAGDLMGATGDQGAAREAYLRVGTKSRRYVDARARLAWSYQDEDPDAALKLAQDTVAAEPDSYLAQVTLSDLLRADKKFAQSAQVIDPLIARLGDKADWRLYYMRGVALERSGEWPKAEADFSKALVLRPNQPEVLNYLGYSWVNRGERVNEGMALIQKAVDLRPDEGAYVDSLGWAHYRLGQYPKAVELLEKAVGLEAGDPEINDHLGDAYWRVGRRDEARFQWAAVLTLDPDPDVKERVQRKLDSALGPDAVAASSVAAQSLTPK
jgi:tetratricopeptide (TPR) repeat protein